MVPMSRQKIDKGSKGPNMYMTWSQKVDTVDMGLRPSCSVIKNLRGIVALEVKLGRTWS